MEVPPTDPLGEPGPEHLQDALLRREAARQIGHWIPKLSGALALPFGQDPLYEASAVTIVGAADAPELHDVDADADDIHAREIVGRSDREG